MASSNSNSNPNPNPKSTQPRTAAFAQPLPSSHTPSPSCNIQEELRKQRYFRFASRPFTTSSSDTNVPSPNTAAFSSSSTSSATTSQPSSSSNEPTDFLPATTLTNKFKNMYRMATGQMSPAGAAAYWRDADERYSTTDCNRCTSQRDFLLRYSPVIRYLSSNIRQLGGDLDTHNIRCRTCTVGQLGGFDAKYGIVLCANYVSSRDMLEDVMAHEMVHAYDHLRFKVDLGADEDLRKVACSEIRASNLSGECRWANEFFGNWIPAFTSHQQECVKRRATISVKMRPNCRDEEEAKRVVNEVWDSCFADTRPFDEIYR